MHPAAPLPVLRLPRFLRNQRVEILEGLLGLVKLQSGRRSPAQQIETLRLLHDCIEVKQ